MGSLVKTDKCIKFSYGHFITAKQAAGSPNKHASSIKKLFSGYLRWNYTTPKSVTHLRTYYTEIVPSHDVIFDETFIVH